MSFASVGWGLMLLPRHARRRRCKSARKRPSWGVVEGRECTPKLGVEVDVQHHLGVAAQREDDSRSRADGGDHARMMPGRRGTRIAIAESVQLLLRVGRELGR